MYLITLLLTVPAILTSFDTRLIKLEKSVLPLYNSTQILNRRAKSASPRLAEYRNLS